MLFSDTYYTITEPSTGLFKDKGSRFIAYAFPVKNEEDIKKHLQELRKEHFSARHHCYAWILNPDKSAFRANDDGEPSGSAGKPIYNQILSADLTNILVVVVRYFGGTLLGVSGLINAYKLAAQEAINQAQKTEKLIQEHYAVTFSYEQTNALMKIIKDMGLKIIEQESDLNCRYIVSVRKSQADQFLKKCADNRDWKTEWIRTV